MREDLKKIIEDNWEDIQALIIEKAEAEQKPKNIWDLNIRDGEIYGYISSSGKIGQSYFDSIYDENARDIGNAFLTKEEAEFEVERRKIETIMRKYSRPYEAGEYNYCILYFHNEKRVGVGCYSVTEYGLLHFESKEIARKVIDEIGEDRLKKYWFGVKE